MWQCNSHPALYQLIAAGVQNIMLLPCLLVPLDSLQVGKQGITERFTWTRSWQPKNNPAGRVDEVANNAILHWLQFYIGVPKSIHSPLQPPITNSLGWKLVLRAAWQIPVLLQLQDIKARWAGTALCWMSLHRKTLATSSRVFLSHFGFPSSCKPLQYPGFCFIMGFSCCFFPRWPTKKSKRCLSLHTVIPAHTGSRNHSCCTKALQTQLMVLAM